MSQVSNNRCRFAFPYVFLMWLVIESALSGYSFDARNAVKQDAFRMYKRGRKEAGTGPSK